VISILIPAYRYDVRPLVRALQAQARELAVAWEILVYDDGSGGPWPALHEELNELEGVRFRALDANVGRAAVRNLLGRAARHEHLLFLDGDSGIERADFLAVYVRQLPCSGVLYGGRTYTVAPPADPELLLHWRYGRERESQPASVRARRPYHGFMTNNFCIRRTVFLEYPFDEDIQGYGHEDTCFGLILEQHRIPIIHLDNPVVHLGLEARDEFLRKQAQATGNLAFLRTRYPGLHTRALDLWRDLRRLRLLPLAYPLLNWLGPRARRRLRQQPRASFRWLDLLKLYWLEQATSGRDADQGG
jgi:glycosyltransferase involved in cell wall biosynthesis